MSAKRSFLLTLILVVFFCGPVSGQRYDSNDRLAEGSDFIFRELLREQRNADGFYSILQDFMPKSPPLFWPGDLSVPSWDNIRVDNFIKTQRGLFMAIDGTFRLYRLSRNATGRIGFERLDSTVHVGYNHFGYTFHWNDTIFSLGGYGFWRWNGQLKRFNPQEFDWNIVPINEEIPIEANYTIREGMWIDPVAPRFYYVEKNHGQETLKRQLDNNIVMPDARVHRLNYSTGDWETLGVLTPDAHKIMITTHRLGSTPYGEILMRVPLPDRDVIIVDYKGNQVYHLKPEKAQQVIGMVLDLGGHATHHGRVVTYHSDSTFIMLSTLGKRLECTISRADLIPAGYSIYQHPILATVSSNATFLISSVLILAVLGWIGYRKVRNNPQEVDTKADQLFEPIEKQLILAICNRKDQPLTTIEINDMLGTSRKSPAVQRKQRSERIRIINEKARKLTGTEMSLIYQDKAEDDKRIAFYRVNEDILDLLKSHLR